MLDLLSKGTAACFMFLCAAVLTACVQGPSLGDGADEDMIPTGVLPMMVDASKTVSTPIVDLTLEHCLGRPDVENAVAQTTDCSEPGAFEIFGIATLGEGAPAAEPDGANQDQLAFKVCDVFYEDWAEEQGSSATALFKIIVISDDWNGPSTDLVCGGRPQS